MSTQLTQSFKEISKLLQKLLCLVPNTSVIAVTKILADFHEYDVHWEAGKALAQQNKDRRGEYLLAVGLRAQVRAQRITQKAYDKHSEEIARVQFEACTMKAEYEAERAARQAEIDKLKSVA